MIYATAHRWMVCAATKPPTALWSAHLARDVLGEYNTKVRGRTSLASNTSFNEAGVRSD
jgi:hypothetical protein